MCSRTASNFPTIWDVSRLYSFICVELMVANIIVDNKRINQNQYRFLTKEYIGRARLLLAI